MIVTEEQFILGVELKCDIMSKNVLFFFALLKVDNIYDNWKVLIMLNFDFQLIKNVK